MYTRPALHALNDAVVPEITAHPAAVDILHPPLPRPESAPPTYFLNLFFTASVWALLVTETNHCAAQHLERFANTLGRSARARHPMTIHSMRTLFASYLLSGLIYKPRVAHYWSTDPVYRAAKRVDVTHIKLVSVVHSYYWNDRVYCGPTVSRL